MATEGANQMGKISFESGEDFQFDERGKTGRRTEANSVLREAAQTDSSANLSLQDSVASNLTVNAFNNETRAEIDDPVRMQLLSLNGGTGEYNSNRTSPRKVATQVQGLVPINIDPSFEFYLGIRNPQTKKYDGERLFYDKETTELEPCSATKAHNNNQLWRF